MLKRSTKGRIMPDKGIETRDAVHQDLTSNFGNNVNSSELLIGFDFDF